MDSNGLKDVAFWLSAEDYLMGFPPDAEGARYFLMWRATPCVVIGRNQLAEAEIDLAAAERTGVGVTRRSSGGGAVYLDPGSMQYAVIQPYAPGGGDDALKIARAEVSGAIARALGGFGVPAAVEGRNDVTAGGAKISGVSQLVRGGWLNTHGTLLYDADLEALGRLLKPDDAKFTSKAVRSVRSRVTNIKAILADAGGRPDAGPAGQFMAAFEARMRKDAAEQGRPFAEFSFSPGDFEKIEAIRLERYANPGAVFKSSPPFTFRAARRFPQGKVDVYVCVKAGITEACAIRGDFIGAAPVEELERALCGRPFQIGCYEAAADEKLVADCLGGVGKAEFLDMLFS